MLEHFQWRLGLPLPEGTCFTMLIFFQLNLLAAAAALKQIVLSRKAPSVSFAPVVTEWSQMLGVEGRTGSRMDSKIQGPNWESTPVWNGVPEQCFLRNRGECCKCKFLYPSWQLLRALAKQRHLQGHTQIRKSSSLEKHYLNFLSILYVLWIG